MCSAVEPRSFFEKLRTQDVLYSAAQVSRFRAYSQDALNDAIRTEFLKTIFSINRKLRKTAEQPLG